MKNKYLQIKNWFSDKDNMLHFKISIIAGITIISLFSIPFAMSYYWEAHSVTTEYVLSMQHKFNDPQLNSEIKEFSADGKLSLYERHTLNDTIEDLFDREQGVKDKVKYLISPQQ